VGESALPLNAVANDGWVPAAQVCLHASSSIANIMPRRFCSSKWQRDKTKRPSEHIGCEEA
jgi:hypothetical protein